METTDSIINRVAASSIISLDLEEYFPEAPRLELDIRPSLYQELLLREKDYRLWIANLDLSLYAGADVALHCSVDAIIPVWAYMLAATKLISVAKSVFYGNLDSLEQALWQQSLDQKLDYSSYQDARVIIKGCSQKAVPVFAYSYLSMRLQPFVASLMYGEPCSSVPVYKRAKTQN